MSSSRKAPVHRLSTTRPLAAVRRGGPYGELSRAYKENELNIFAFFRYNLVHSSRSIFGNN